jgi:D-alanyl-D-alanine carboxypeptidase/D-alanyl-D-alanine-endopeptidase (penicillin-binding protein 4)
VAGYVLSGGGRRYVLVAVINHANANQARPALEAMVQWAANDFTPPVPPEPLVIVPPQPASLAAPTPSPPLSTSPASSAPVTPPLLPAPASAPASAVQPG